MKHDKNTLKKLRLNTQTIQVLTTAQAQLVCGGLAKPNMQITDVLPKCGTFNCDP